MSKYLTKGRHAGWDLLNSGLKEDLFSLFETASLFNDIQTSSTFPKVNISETDTFYEVEAAVAGFNKSDISLNMKDNVLYLSARQSSECTKTYLRKEISSRDFVRAIRFPKKVDTSNIKATYTDGILSVIINKAVDPSKESTTITIN